MISSPVRLFQPRKTSADSTSAADNAIRSEEKSVPRAVGLGQRSVERGQSEKHGGTVRPIASKIAAGFGWPGSSSVVAPTENGKVMELPKP